VIKIRKILIGVLAIILLSSVISLGHAAVYTGSWHSGLGIYPEHSLDVAIDTSQNKWTFYYQGAWVIGLPFPTPFLFASYVMWDDEGYYHDGGFPDESIDPTGTITFYDYYHRGTWTHTAVKWVYSVFYWSVVVQGQVNIYVPDSNGGGGCPTLFAYNGTYFVTEGFLDIHDPEGTDIVFEHTLISEPQPLGGTYQFQLIEHPKTHSYIDQVKLYAVVEDGRTIRLPLIGAEHSDDGNVLSKLLLSDDKKIDILGADLNGGISERIDLKFATLSPKLEVTRFIFEIEGNNMLPK
jgi:hypothetical protein